MIERFATRRPLAIWLRSLLALSVAGSVAAGCGGAGPVPADAGPPPDAGLRPDAPAPVDAGSDAPPSGGDGNDSFATATPVAIDADPAASDVIMPAGDVDFFRFEGERGAWIAIYTASEPVEGMPRVDTVITLYDASMMQIAENDDALPRADTDSEIILRLPATGTYYYRVQEFSTWAPDMVMGGPRGGSSYTYETRVLALDASDPRVVVDPETGDDAASAAPLEFLGGATIALGTFDGPGDLDVFSFTNTSTAVRPELLQIEVMPPGPMGYGATRTAGRIWVTDETGTVIVARGTIGDGITSISPALTEMTTHLLWIEAPGGAPGANDHYVVKAIYGPENPPLRSEPNDTLASAETRTLQPVDPADPGAGERAFLLARLPPGDPADYVSFAVMARRALTVVCGSRTSGSGLRDLRVELRDGSDAVLGSATETATANAVIEGHAVASAGTYFLRLSAASHDPEVRGDWVRCAIVAVPGP